MSNISPQGEQSTSTEIAALANLTALATSGAGFAIAKTGTTSFVNVSLLSGIVNISYAQLPTGGGTWANGGTLSITGGVTTVAGLVSSSASEFATSVVVSTSSTSTAIRAILESAYTGYLLGYVGLATFANANSAQVFLARYNGTPNTPTAVVSGNLIGDISFGGYDGSTIASMESSRARIRVLATENWSTTAAGNQIVFSTTPNTTLSPVSAFAITQSGDLAMVAGKKFYPDGVAGTGDTYVTESSANVLDIYVGGTNIVKVNTTGVGIGAAGVVAQAPLHINSDTLPQFRMYSTTTTNPSYGIIVSANGTMYFGKAGSSASSLITTGGLAYACGLNIDGAASAMQFATGDTARITILTGGNVGIGTNAPTQLLEIFSASSVNQFILLNGANDFRMGYLANDTSFRIQDATTDRLLIDSSARTILGGSTVSTEILLSLKEQASVSAGIALQDTDDTRYAFIGMARATNDLLTGSANLDLVINHTGTAGGVANILFGTTNTERMRITSGGNVGIGTNAPNEKLEVAGAGLFTAALAGNRTSATAIDFSAGAARFFAYGPDATTAGTMRFYVSANDGSPIFEAIHIDSSGRVGIGDTSSPTAILHLKAGTATASTAPLKFTSGTLLTTAEAGAVEFLTDAYYGTITTGAARKTFAFLESPSFTTPTLGVATATSINGNIFTTGTYTLTGVAGKTLTFNKSITLEGTDATTMTFPSTSATIARTDTLQTFTGTQTFSNAVIYTNNAITASGNAATVPVTAKLNTVTNNSAATLTITMTTASAVDGQMTIVRILDASAVAQTITWVNTENSTVTAPTTSNGSTTLFLTVEFIYNGGTSKWRCIASA